MRIERFARRRGCVQVSACPQHNLMICSKLASAAAPLSLTLQLFGGVPPVVSERHLPRLVQFGGTSPGTYLGHSLFQAAGWSSRLDKVVSVVLVVRAMTTQMDQAVPTHIDQLQQLDDEEM
eukprot:2833027-Rhodomonas_salina.1